MQTVYLLKNCIKSYNALKKLYTTPDISTNIIIVDRIQSKILFLDKRVKKFPFIINTQPTNIGLIPKTSRVLPLELFLSLKNKGKRKYTKPKNKKHKDKYNYHYINNKYLNGIYDQDHDSYKKYVSRNNYSNNYISRNKYKKEPMIRKEIEPDGSINIILNK
tara:strand:+ start:105 stop:590 length:486 start_codon:yes stop_codon:yes gene_type:complete